MISAFILVLSAIVFQGDISLFISVSSFLIVAGGVISVTIVNYSIVDLKVAFENLLHNLKNSEIDLRIDIEMMNLFARKARREGMLALEDDIQHIQDPFLKNNMMYMLDGINKETLESIMTDQLASAERSLDKSVNILAAMAEYSPAFGMIGTVIGLVLMLQNIQDPESLGMGLAIALITTLYGTIFANMIFLPLSGKLDHLSERQLTRKKMQLVAILSLVGEDSPRIIESKMLNFLTPSERAAYTAYYARHSFDKKHEEQLQNKWQQFQNRSWENLVAALATG